MNVNNATLVLRKPWESAVQSRSVHYIDGRLCEYDSISSYEILSDMRLRKIVACIIRIDRDSYEKVIHTIT